MDNPSALSDLSAEGVFVESPNGSLGTPIALPELVFGKLQGLGKPKTKCQISQNISKPRAKCPHHLPNLIQMEMASRGSGRLAPRLFAN